VVIECRGLAAVVAEEVRSDVEDDESTCEEQQFHVAAFPRLDAVTMSRQTTVRTIARR